MVSVAGSARKVEIVLHLVVCKVVCEGLFSVLAFGSFFLKGLVVERNPSLHQFVTRQEKTLTSVGKSLKEFP